MFGREPARRAMDVQERLEHIADMLIARRRVLAIEIVGQVRAEIPEYESPPRESLEDITQHVELLAKMVRGRRVGAKDFDFIGPHAARRARDGVPLAAARAPDRPGRAHEPAPAAAARSKRTPVSSSETAHSLAATSSSCAERLGETTCGWPRNSPIPSGPT